MSQPGPESSSWSSPPDFLPVVSAVEGIRVYAPRPKEVEAQAPQTFTCPQCGASTQYNIAAGGVTCEHCGYSTPIQVQIAGARAATHEFTLDVVNQSERGWGVEHHQLHCDSCGAELALSEGQLSTTCPFCASNKVNVTTPMTSDQVRPRFLVPFKVLPAKVRTLSQAWLQKGWFHPDELASNAGINRFLGIYLPFWTFDANIASQWKAEVGYEHTERYYDSHNKEWRSRTVIRWRWENGQVSLGINNLLITGSSHLSRLILERLYPFNFNDLVPYTPDFLAGWQAHAYDVTLTQGWEAGKAAMREQAKKTCYADIPSPHVRNFTMTADFGDEAWRYILLPVYLAAYKFEDNVYQVMINGQTGVVAGQKPVAWWKIWLAIAAMLAPGLLMCLIGLPLSLVGVGIFLLVIGFILLVAGGIFAVRLYRQAVASEAA